MPGKPFFNRHERQYLPIRLIRKQNIHSFLLCHYPDNGQGKNYCTITLATIEGWIEQ